VRLIFFDLDGTLLPGTSASLEIAKATGTTTQLLTLEGSFARGECTTFQFAQAIASLWSEVTLEHVAQAFAGCPKLSNIGSTLELVREYGWRSCLITMSPTFFAFECLAWGFDFVYGSEFQKPIHPFAVGAPVNILCPEDKVRIAETVCSENSTQICDSIAFGDSASDVFLFDRVAYSVAVNGTTALRARANLSYEGNDLLEAFTLMLDRVVPGKAETANR
jgi:phosphoserine phosphatase